MATVWVFMGEGARHPAGVFADESSARSWIRDHGLSGILTEYPLGRGVYDHAIERGWFRPKSPSHGEASFIGRFSSAYLSHIHFEGGLDETGLDPDA